MGQVTRIYYSTVRSYCRVHHMPHPPLTDKNQVQQTASKSLAVFGHDPHELGNALIRIAVAPGNTASATAVIHALLALSALHRHGGHPQVMELKISALEALQSSLRSCDACKTTATQHVAAGMLICSLEASVSKYLAGRRMLTKHIRSTRRPAARTSGRGTSAVSRTSYGPRDSTRHHSAGTSQSCWTGCSTTTSWHASV